MPLPLSHEFGTLEFASELVFAVLAVILCFRVYFKTREIYSLTKHEGVRYFREAFFLFGVSYFIRFLSIVFMISTFALDVFIPGWLVGLFFILPLTYLSTMAIFCLLFSATWKRFKGRNLLFVGNVVSLVLVIVSFITRSHLVLLGFQAVLLAVAVFLGVKPRSDSKKSKRISSARSLYFFMAFLWLLNLMVLIPPRNTLHELIEVTLQVGSIVVLVLVDRKISKWIK